MIRTFRVLFFIPLVFSLAGCAMMIPKYCPEQTEFVFKFPYVDLEVTGCDTACSGIDFGGFPISTQGGRIMELTDTIRLDTTIRRDHFCAYKYDTEKVELHIGRHQQFCSSSLCREGWIDQGFEYSEDCTERMMFYLYNPGPGMRSVPMWDGVIMSTFEISTPTGWKVIDTYSAPCGTGRGFQTLYPNEVMACSVALRKGKDLVQARICFDNNCSEEFMTTVNLDGLFELKHPWH